MRKSSVKMRILVDDGVVYSEVDATPLPVGGERRGTLSLLSTENFSEIFFAHILGLIGEINFLFFNFRVIL